jgi:hypothetical protein
METPYEQQVDLAIEVAEETEITIAVLLRELCVLRDKKRFLVYELVV